MLFLGTPKICRHENFMGGGEGGIGSSVVWGEVEHFWWEASPAPLPPSFVCICIVLILDAAYRFYRTRAEEQSIKRRGKMEIKNKTKRRHERIVRVSIVTLF